MSASLDNALVGAMHKVTFARQGHHLGAEQAEAKRSLLYQHRAPKPFTMDYVTLIYVLPLHHSVT